MNIEKAKNELKEWINNLLLADLGILKVILSNILAIDKLDKGVQEGFKFLEIVNQPLSAFGFSNSGVSEKKALSLLKDIEYRAGIELLFSDEWKEQRVGLFAETIKILKYIQNLVETRLKNENGEKAISFKTGKARTFIESNFGYFQFHKRGKKIPIGKKWTRHFNLLQTLCEPHCGTRKTIEAVFEGIRQPKDNRDSALRDFSPDREGRMLTIINNAKKELQKIKELQRKIKYCFDGSMQSMWIEVEG